MISEEKMVHICHLLIDGLYKVDYVDYTDDDAALKEAKKVCLTYLNQINKITETARKRISTQKNAPLEGTRQWDTLFQKYYEEEAAKFGG
jgi:hypothetical protein